MHTTPLRSAALVFGLVAGLLLAACDTDPASSLFDPNYQALPSPVITSISPAAPPEIVLAGIDEIVITGENFSADLSNNFVYFNAERGTVIEASPTRLRVRVPNLPQANLEIRVMVLGAMEFSNTVPYALSPAVVPFGTIQPTESVFGMTSDRDGNLYLSLFAETPQGVKRFSRDGTREDYFATFSWTDLDIGPDGLLYGVRPAQAVFRLPQGGAAQPLAVLPSVARPSVLTFGDAGEVWAWSTHTTGLQVLFRVGPDQSITEYPMPGTVRDMVVFDGFLYIAITQSNVSRVMRHAIQAGGQLGAAEEYANLSSALNVEGRSLAFAVDGTLFVGTQSLIAETAHDPMVIVAPDRSVEVLYPGILRPAASNVSVSILSLAWDGGTGIYALRRRENLRAVAPERPVSFSVVRIETRRQGAQ